MFTISVSIVNSASIFVGIMIAYIGPRYTCVIGSIVVGLGALIIGLSSPSLPMYMPGYIILGLGGTAVAFPMFTLPLLAPKQHAGLIFSLIIGSFDGSSAVMFF